MEVYSQEICLTIFYKVPANVKTPKPFQQPQTLSAISNRRGYLRFEQLSALMYRWNTGERVDSCKAHGIGQPGLSQSQ